MNQASLLIDRLATALRGMGANLDARQEMRLLGYLDLIVKWNRTYNLTAIHEPERMLTHHLLDSLAILPMLGAGPLLDVGSGAGLPGIPLAIARPELYVTLLDSSQKRCGFMQQAVIELNSWPIPKLFRLIQRLGEVDHEEAARGLGAHDQIELLDKIMELTMPQGIVAFLERLTGLFGAVGRQPSLSENEPTSSPNVPNGKAPDMQSQSASSG